jgi:cell wall-associated NlpC family hydrolase
VRCPWQPSPKSVDGYPGWVPTTHLRALTTEAELAPYPQRTGPAGGGLDGDASREANGEHPTVSLARQHLGLPYLWGGLTPYGFDCSGLVHWAWRTLGVLVPRDAYAQQDALASVDLDAVQPGDLYFFAHSGRRIHHVGIVTAPGRMVHASETGGVLVEEDLPPERAATLVAAARVAG